MRKEIRYQVDGAALFSWESSEHKRLQGEGVTRDVSVLGAFILTPTCPPIDIPVQVEIVLPSLTGFKPVIIRIIGEARVLRVEHARGKNGFAVVTQNLSRWGLATDESKSAELAYEDVS